MADIEVIVIDDSSDEEEPVSTSAVAAAAAPTTHNGSSAGGQQPSAKRARVDPSSPGSADNDGGAIITPSLTGASTVAASTAGASAGTGTAAGGGGATSGSKKRPSPTLGDEAKKLDPSLAAASSSSNDSTLPNPSTDDEEPINITKPRQTIVDILAQSKTPPSFGTGSSPLPSTASIGFPGLLVNGEGPVAFPLLPAQAVSLASRGTQHPVRQAPLFQWLPNQFNFANPTFATGLIKLKKHMCDTLRIDSNKVSCVLYKMLLHGPGGNTLSLRNATTPGNVASIVLLLPALYTGGKITITREGSSTKQSYDFAYTNSYDYAYFALFGCSAYEIEPLQTGSRLMLVYNIIQDNIDTAASANPTANISKRIRFRDEARIRREFRAATEKWDTSTSNDEKPLVWMTENQYARSHLGKASAKSHFKGNDRKVVELLQQCIREGANADWCVGKVDYVVEGKGKNNPDSSSSQDYVFDRKTSEKLTIDLGNLSKLVFTYNNPAGKYVCPTGYYDNVTPNDNFTRSYSYYDDDYQTKATRTYPSRSCLFVWPRSQTWKCIGRESEIGTETMVTRMIKYLEESNKSRFAGPLHIDHSKKLVHDFLKSLSSYYCTEKLPKLVSLIISFDSANGAEELIKMIGNSEFRKKFYEEALRPLLQHFEPSVLVEKMSSVMGNGLYTSDWAEYVLKILEVKCGDMNENSKVHPFRQVLVEFSKRIYDKSSNYNVSDLGKQLGCRSDDYGYYYGTSYWPKHSVSDLLVRMCENFHVKENVHIEGLSPSAPSNVFCLFTCAIVRALAWNKVTNESTMERIATNFSIIDLQRVGKTMGASEVGCMLMARCFVEETPLEVAADLTVQVIKEAKKNGARNESDEPTSAVNLFVLPLLKGVANTVSPQFAVALMKRLNKDASKGQHKELAKTLRSVAGFEVDVFLSFLCEIKQQSAAPTGGSASSVASKNSADTCACSSDDIATLFCSLGSAFVDQSTPEDREIFSRLLSKKCLTAVFARCGQSTLGKRIKGWADNLDLGPGAGIVLQFCELEEEAGGSSTSEAASSTTDSSGISPLCQEFLHGFAKRVIGKDKASPEAWITSLTASLSAQKIRSGDLDEPSPVWPANSIGIIASKLAERSCSASNNVPSVTDFLSVTFQAIARDRSTALIKSESSRNTAKRLLSASDVAVAFKHIGLPAVTKLLEDLVAALPFSSAADFIVAGQSSRIKSSAAALAFITADALKLIATDNEAEEIAVKLMISFVHKRIIGSGGGRAHYDSLSSNLDQHKSLTRDIFHHLCRDLPSAQGSAAASSSTSTSTEQVGVSVIKAHDITGFLSAVCYAVTASPPKFRFHENTFLQQDFDATVKTCGFAAASGALYPSIITLNTANRISESTYILNLLLSNATNEAEFNGCALHLALMVLKALQPSPSGSLLEKRALAMIMFWTSHFEGTAPAVWTSALTAACAPAPPGPFAAPLAASTRLVAMVFKFDLQAISSFLAEADTLLSSSIAESKTIASVRVSALFEQISSRAISMAQGKVTVAPRRPTSSWKLVDDGQYLTYYLYDYMSFLSNACSTQHTQKCKSSIHSRVKAAFRPMVQRGEVKVDFFQYNGRGLWYIRITKLKKKTIDRSSTVPRCKCGARTCELNRYHREVANGGATRIDQGFVDGLKESKSVFSLRAKGQRPEPEVEFVENAPKPQAEVVDLIE